MVEAAEIVEVGRIEGQEGMAGPAAIEDQERGLEDAPRERLAQGLAPEWHSTLELEGGMDVGLTCWHRLISSGIGMRWLFI